MVEPREHRPCFATPAQRDVLVALLKQMGPDSGFFLTGGTALSVFYLHHRLSNDLDLFTRRPFDGSEVLLALRAHWAGDCVVTKQAPGFLSLQLGDVKVDFVHDPLSLDSRRPTLPLQEDLMLCLDGIEDIASNKLCTAVSRQEPKDFVDLFFLRLDLPALSIDAMVESARRKEALFDDPLTAAYQLERNFAYVRDKPHLLPHLLRPLDKELWVRSIDEIAGALYRRGGATGP
jgi:hypothetical protein